MISVSRVRRFSVPLGMFVREYYRNLLNLVFLVTIPVALILAFGDAMGQLAGIFEASFSEGTGESLAALWSAAFLSGITGFFMMVGARAADRRLVRAGYGTAEVVLLRFAAVGVLGALATGVSYAVLLTQLTPENGFQALLAMYLGALIYGAAGILVGSLIAGELEGSFALVFFFMMDAFLASPLFGETADALRFLPTYYPTKVLLALTAGEPHKDIHWLYVVLYLLVAGTLAGVAFYRAARVRS